VLEPIPIPNGAWEVIIMDFICGLPKSEGKNVIMIVIDKFTKYYHLIGLTHPFTTATVADNFFQTVHRLYGVPAKIITDRDPIFTSTFWKDLMGKLSIKLNFTTAYHTI
jgi:Integrase core domain